MMLKYTRLFLNSATCFSELVFSSHSEVEQHMTNFEPIKEGTKNYLHPEALDEALNIVLFL